MRTPETILTGPQDAHPQCTATPNQVLFLLGFGSFGGLRLQLGALSLNLAGNLSGGHGIRALLHKNCATVVLQLVNRILNIAQRAVVVFTGALWRAAGYQREANSLIVDTSITR